MADIEKIANTCVMQHMRRTTRSVTQLFDEALRPVGLTAGQFSTLVAVARKEGGALTPLAQQLGMDRTTLTRALAPMERNGWLSTSAGPRDSRARVVFLTDDGRELLTRAMDRWQQAQEVALKRIGVNAWDKIRPALRDLQN